MNVWFTDNTFHKTSYTEIAIFCVDKRYNKSEFIYIAVHVVEMINEKQQWNLCGGNYRKLIKRQ